MTKPFLYVNGDSWSWHQNLDTEWLWPQRVAKSLGMKLLNESAGCGSNSRIHDNILNLYASGKIPDLVLIGLTNHARYHMPAADFGAWSIGPLVAINDRTGETNDQIRDWTYKSSYDIVDSIYRYYKTIWNINLVCRSFGTPVYFWQIWDDKPSNYNVLYDHTGRSTLLKNIKDFYIQEKYALCFDFFAKQAWDNYWESPLKRFLASDHLDNTGHPNELGHEVIAYHILKDLLSKGIAAS